MEDVVVRRAASNDVEGIQRVGLLTWPPAYLPFTSASYVLANLQQWWTQEAVERSLGSTLVAVRGDDVVGTATTGRWNGEPIVWKVYVLPDLHGTGVADQLMRAVLDGLPADEDVLIEFVQGNERARRFYERYGFGPDHTVEGDDGTTTVWYRLRRAPA